MKSTVLVFFTLIYGIAPAQHIAAMGPFTLALCSDSTMMAWGTNATGALGSGSTAIASNIPVNVSNLTGIKKIASGGAHSMALRYDSTLWTWGFNILGQLGVGDTINRNVPVQANINGVIAMAGGSNHTLAVKSDGTVWSWGYNGYGQCGFGGTSNTDVPVQINPNILSNVIAVACTEYSSMALKNDGTVWTWGRNFFGQLGIGNTTNKDIPVHIASLNNIVAIAAGWNHCMALTTTGEVWSWGNNSKAQLGIGTNIHSYIPVQTNTPTGIRAIAAGQSHALALRNDSTVWTWGWNVRGQLGNGSSPDSGVVPVQVNNIYGVTEVAGGGNHSLAKKGDGTVWCWGENVYGELGIGSYIDSYYPAQSTGACAILSGINESDTNADIAVYPNPFSTTATMESSVLLKDAQLYIYNVQGKIVMHIEDITGNSIEFKRGNLTQGIYLLQLIQDGERIGGTKILVGE